MALYTMILEYRQGSYVSQVEARSEAEAVKKWVACVEIDAAYGLTEKSRPLLTSQFPEDRAVALTGIKNVWCCTARLRGNLALLDIIKTASRRRW